MVIADLEAYREYSILEFSHCSFSQDFLFVPWRFEMIQLALQAFDYVTSVTVLTPYVGLRRMAR